MNLRNLASCVLTAALATGAAALAAEPSQSEESVAPQFRQALPNVPGKSFTSVIVSFPPGAKAASHRHGQAFVYAYVLDGAVRSQLDDEPAKVYQAGQDWYEAPGALHRLTENASSTEPARLLVVFIADTGAPLKTPEHR
jgi:quercetin dioxygenase-like cupin family protein